MKERQKFADKKWKYAKAGEQVLLYAVLTVQFEGKQSVFTDAKIKKQVLHSDSWPHKCPLRLTWFKIEPVPKSYDNSLSLPLAFIEYKEAECKHGWKVLADVHPTLMHDQFGESVTGYSVMRYKLEAKISNATVSSTGLECRRDGALCDNVVTVICRPDNTCIGYHHDLL